VSAWEQYADAVLTDAAAVLADPAGASSREAGRAAAEGLQASLSEPVLFSAVCASAGLSPAEVQALALLVAVELSPERQRLVSVLHEDLTRHRLTLSLLADLLPAPHPGALTVAEGGRLRGAALVAVEKDGPWAGREVWAAPALVWSLLGDDSPDPDLPADVTVVPGAGGAAQDGVLHLVSGGDRRSRRMAAAAALGGHGVLVVPAAAERREWDAVVREATLGGLAVLVEVAGGEVPGGLGDLLRRADHLAWGLSSEGELPLSDLPDCLRREVAVADGTATEAEWVALTGAPAPAGVRLDRRQLELVALTDAPPAAAVRRLAGGHLDRLAVRVRPRRGWDDLVLPGPLEEQVRGLVARHQQRRVVYDEWGFPGLPSRGTVALLAGPSGTGKTLTAEVVAGELGLDLFVLDLSSVVSKYIGETEKNLGALFDAAATGDVVLFFDEADALFGTRSAVTDAKDRYANVEVAYLLQRLERHDGLVLLATNLPNNIDEAFLRRLHATLEFTAPGPQQRRGIWERAFPPGCPVKDVDVDLLAREADLSGGAIATAAVGAAFAAAAAAEPVTMQRVVAAVTAEYRKLGRLSAPRPCCAERVSPRAAARPPRPRPPRP
jgi:hypothetical protein